MSFKEFNTSKYIQSILSKHNISFTNGHVETGIIATVEGNNPMDKEILLRADIDAYQFMKKMKLIIARKTMVKCMLVVMMFIVHHFLELH